MPLDWPPSLTAADVFTSMGVLLSLQTMDRTKLEYLGETRGRDGALESGMQYLKAASRFSTLAKRYVDMLERIRTVPSTDTTAPNTATVVGVPPEAPPTSVGAHDAATSPRLSATQDPRLYDPVGDLPMFDDSGLIDFNNDLLFGTGLPRDLLASDWSVFGAPY
jgi:hypothetical protein